MSTDALRQKPLHYTNSMYINNYIYALKLLLTSQRVSLTLARIRVSQLPLLRQLDQAMTVRTLRPIQAQAIRQSSVLHLHAPMRLYYCEAY